MDRAVRLVEAIARKTYQRGLGAGFRDTPEARSRWRTAAGQGCLRAYVLWLGGEPAAFCTGFALDSTLWLEHLGFDPVFRRFRPGTHLILRVIADLAEQRQVRRIDFGIGDADYKRRLCHESRDDVSVFVFAPTCKGIWLNGLRSLADGMGRAGQWCLERLGLLSWFKRRWRRALQPKEADPDAE